MSDERIGETRGSSWQLPAIVILGLVAVVGLIFGWKASAALDGTQQAVAAQVKSARQAMDQDLAAVKDRLALAEKTNAGLQSDLSVVTKRLRITQGQLKAAREEAAKLREETTQQITALDTSVKGELATKASADELRSVDSKVGVVRTDLDATREDLKMARSEMGTLIARNHEEIEQLRRLGERDYIEFTIAGKGKPQKVGNVTLELRGTNVKKSQFSVALVVEDKRFDKKNRALNEPIFFYATGTRQPEEIVINRVEKNQISGYLSIPKANAQPKAASASSSGSSH